MLPYRTDDGLYLEDDGVLIPWGTPLDPNHPPTGAEVRRRKVFEWKGRRALAGLFGDLWTVLFPTEDPQGFPHNLQALHCFSMHLTTDANQGASRVLLGRVHDLFARALGPATFSYPCYDSGLPAIHWATDNLHYSCSAAGPAAVNVFVQQIPTEPVDLRAEWDRKHRECASYDARVPFVAWDHQDAWFPEETRRRHRALVEHDARRHERIAAANRTPTKGRD